MKIVFSKKTKTSSGYAGGSIGSTLDPSSLRYIPYDPADDSVWLVPDRPIKTNLGFIGSIRGDIGEFGDVTAKGDVTANGYIRSNSMIEAVKDIVAFSSTNNVRLINEPSSATPHLWELPDTSIVDPKRGDVLVYDGSKWLNDKDITIDSGEYKGY